jgi:hypothetical protein
MLSLSMGVLHENCMIMDRYTHVNVVLELNSNSQWPNSYCIASYFQR